ncbi:5-carboxymethyl-2-hydroxymuconate Delta-isomerase [Shimia biformata]|uniref:5-carboxymethyl-2-hydroxymuconate Delta-isomerase n=1 Tax=Shimia biformata TaxID=1294299 RepID=UPI001951C445|nr:5-carboxymethyl-2-hydroxymuconate isomerase [Shimia biformata]
MPHLILEHSPSLAGSHDLPALSSDLFQTAQAHPAFASAPQAVKTRTIAVDNVRSGVMPQTFAHLTVRLLSGRDDETKADIANTLLAVLERHLPEVGSLSVEPVDMNRTTYAKRAL